MKPEQWQQLDKLFHSAVRFAEYQVRCMFQRACAGRMTVAQGAAGSPAGQPRWGAVSERSERNPGLGTHVFPSPFERAAERQGRRSIAR